MKLFNDYSKIVSEAKQKTNYREGLKILTPKQMLQRLPIALAQVKAGNTSGNLLNEIRQILYSLYRAKAITKRVFNNIINSIKLKKRRDTILMNSENDKILNPHRLLINLSEKTNLKVKEKVVAL